MLGTTEKPAVRSDPRLEPTVQGPKPATASPGYQQQKARHQRDGLFLYLLRHPLPPAAVPFDTPRSTSHTRSGP